MVTIAYSTLDVALWFVTRARHQSTPFRRQQLFCYLYLAQGLYAVWNNGCQLMPAVFIVGRSGPVEPNVDRLLKMGLPQNLVFSLPKTAEHVLEHIWTHYGHHSSSTLCSRITSHALYREAQNKGYRTEIPFSALARFFREKTHLETPTVETSHGRLQKWVPPTAQLRTRVF